MRGFVAAMILPFKVPGSSAPSVGGIKNDGCLLAVKASDTMNFGRWLIIGKKQIQGHQRP